MTIIVISSKLKLEKPHVLVLLSIDGFGYNYLQYNSSHPNLNRIISEGILSKMIPIFPSKTFPNHYSMITGLYSESHGIVSNEFYDPLLNKTFYHFELKEIRKSEWWLVDPFWNVLNKRNKISASFFWPGSEAKINGSQPTYFIPYNDTIGNEERVNKVLEWLDMPLSIKPSFISLYFSTIDSVGHKYGPDSKELIEAIKEIDKIIGILDSGIENRKNRMDIDLMIVSDHGMVKKKDPIFIDKYIDKKKCFIPELIRYTTHASIWVNESLIPIFLNQLKEVKNADVYTKENLPVRYHYNSSRRIAPLHLIAHPGYLITTEEFFQKFPESFVGGEHGYDPMLEEMSAIFVGKGSSFIKGKRQIPFENIEMFNLMSKIMGVEPTPNNGTYPHINGILNEEVIKKRYLK